jgi:hypothetical protein
MFIDVNNGEFFIINGKRSAPIDSFYVNTYREPRTREVSESDLEWNIDEERLREY